MTVQPPPPEHREADDERRHGYVQSTAEEAECTCPEFCERDHDLD